MEVIRNEGAPRPRADVSRCRVLGLRCLCRKVERNVTPGGIALPEAREQTVNVVEIVRLGDGIEAPSYEKREFRLAVGDHAVVDPRMVSPVKIEGEVLGIIDEDAALVVFPGGESPLCE